MHAACASCTRGTLNGIETLPMRERITTKPGRSCVEVASAPTGLPSFLWEQKPSHDSLLPEAAHLSSPQRSTGASKRHAPSLDTLEPQPNARGSNLLPVHPPSQPSPPCVGLDTYAASRGLDTRRSSKASAWTRASAATTTTRASVMAAIACPRTPSNCWPTTTRRRRP